MTGPIPPDLPTNADVARIRAARRAARVAVAQAERRCVEATEAAFRRELRACVRSASPFLVSLAAIEGMNVDDLAARLDWGFGWPKRPRLSEAMRTWHASAHPLRHAEGKMGRRPPSGPEGPPTGFLSLRSGGWAEVSAIAHSLEVSLTIGSLTFQTRFGELMIHVRGGLPASLAAGGVDRLLDDFVMHPASSGRGWRVEAIESGPTLTTLISRTGVVACRLG